MRTRVQVASPSWPFAEKHTRTHTSCHVSWSAYVVCADAVMEAVFPTGTSVDCINSALQGWVVAYLQQNVDSNVQAQLAATLTSVAPFIAQAQSLPWGDGTKTHAISNASSLLLASEAVMASVSASTPAAAYAYMVSDYRMLHAILCIFCLWRPGVLRHAT